MSRATHSTAGRGHRVYGGRCLGACAPCARTPPGAERARSPSASISRTWRSRLVSSETSGGPVLPPFPHGPSGPLARRALGRPPAREWIASGTRPSCAGSRRHRKIDSARSQRGWAHRNRWTKGARPSVAGLATCDSHPALADGPPVMRTNRRRCFDQIEGGVLVAGRWPATGRAPTSVGRRRTGHGQPRGLPPATRPAAPARRVPRSNGRAAPPAPCQGRRAPEDEQAAPRFRWPLPKRPCGVHS